MRVHPAHFACTDCSQAMHALPVLIRQFPPQHKLSKGAVDFSFVVLDDHDAVVASAPLNVMGSAVAAVELNPGRCVLLH